MKKFTSNAIGYAIVRQKTQTFCEGFDNRLLNMQAVTVNFFSK